MGEQSDADGTPSVEVYEAMAATFARELREDAGRVDQLISELRRVVPERSGVWALGLQIVARTMREKADSLENLRALALLWKNDDQEGHTEWVSRPMRCSRRATSCAGSARSRRKWIRPGASGA